ncbi:MAG: gliding motility protein GldM, partial [Bacteroidota bacterium]|nr:gliding motility protein GldM [Bacteroidota bacterium]
MAGGNVSPRQKMINMMYLVLTALLALNVSAEILNAFKLVKGSLEKTNIGIDESIESQKISVTNLA